MSQPPANSNEKARKNDEEQSSRPSSPAPSYRGPSLGPADIDKRLPPLPPRDSRRDSDGSDNFDLKHGASSTGFGRLASSGSSPTAYPYPSAESSSAQSSHWWTSSARRANPIRRHSEAISDDASPIYSEFGPGPGPGPGPTVQAAVSADDDGTIGVEIDVTRQDALLESMSELGVGKAEGGGWKSMWGFGGLGKGKGKEGGGSGMINEEDGEGKDGMSPGLEEGEGSFGKGKDRAEVRLPPMSIVIFIVGSRGDVQPYIALALALIIHAGHRVRLATHPDFRDFVLSANSRLKGKTHEGVKLEGRLEFFDAGGNPKELMAYMVKNPGLMPGIESLTNGDIKRKRDMAAEYLRGFFHSTFFPDVVSGRQFAADAIISNPPAFAHIHVAEALGLPLQMSFTMPWTATTSFPHPLINVKKSNADQWVANWMGYHLADVLMWEGLGSIINDFRNSILRLDSIPDRTASGIIDTLRIPWTYCWSPELLPKPKDWKSHIDISGFYFLDGEDDFVPPADLAAFLAAGPAPLYMGFGSVVISDPEAVTDMIFEAVENAGVRAIVSAGWAGLGKGREEINPNIFILSKDCSHEWLFANERVAAVCHHGGAGTTSCGLRHGRPTIIVPFFGDQKFWGDAVHNAGAGPAPIPIKTLSAANLTAAFQHAISPEAVAAAGVLGEKIRAEKGEDRGVKSFTRSMPMDDLCCDVDPRKVAVWWCERYLLKLSVEAAGAMIQAQKIMFSDLDPYRSKEYDVTKHNKGPLGGVGVGITSAVSKSFTGPSQLFYKPVQGLTETFYGIPEASVGVIGDLYDGFDNLSGMMGSTPRRTEKITGWKVGMKEGGKALGFGLWDGITGVVTEPIDGARREGVAGFGKGLGRGMVNLINRPAAGSLGLFVLPARGIKASIRSSFGQQQDPHSVLRGPREALTREAMESLTEEYSERLMDTFGVLEGEFKKREKDRKKVQVFLLADKRQREAERVERQRSEDERRQRKEMRKIMEMKVAEGEVGVDKKGKGKGKEGEGDYE